MSRSALIMVLLKKAMEDEATPCRLGRLVHYQERGRRGGYRAFHIRLRPDDYEYLLDLRKFLKMPVSLILAMMVRDFLRGKSYALGWIRKSHGGDKIRFRNYTVLRELVDDVVCWRLFWGFPAGIGRYLQKE